MITHTASGIRRRVLPDVKPVDSAGFGRASIPPTTQAQDVRNTVQQLDEGYDSREGFGQAGTSVAKAEPEVRKTAAVGEPILPWVLASSGVIGVGMTGRDIVSKLRRRQRMLERAGQQKTAGWSALHHALTGAGLLGTGIGAGYALRSAMPETTVVPPAPPRFRCPMYPYLLQAQEQEYPSEKTAGMGTAVGAAFNVGFPAMQYASGETSLGEAAGSMAAATAGWTAGSRLASAAMSALKWTPAGRAGKALKALGTFASGIGGSMAAEPAGIAIGRRFPIAQRPAPESVIKEAAFAPALHKWLLKRFPGREMPSLVAGSAVGAAVGGAQGNKFYEDIQNQAKDEQFAQTYNPYGY